MRSYSLIILVSLLHTFVSAQTIKGMIQDEKTNGLPFVNLRLLNTENKLVKATMTDSAGNFQITEVPVGSYNLRITAIGFLEKNMEVIVDANAVKEFGVITLGVDAAALKNVTVTSLRPTIVQKDDRLVVSVEGTAMAQGSNAFSVLSKAPGVFVDPEGNIQLNGRSGVTIQLDGRQTYLSARELRNLLESMPAENLKNIEIITNPSAKYEAEGTSGILNINLKKNTVQGINGSVYANYNNNFYRQFGYSAGGNINLKAGKWNSFMNVDYNRRTGGRQATFTRIFYGTNTTYFDQEAVGNFVVTGPPNIRLGTDYNFNPQHSVGMMVYFNTNTGRQDFLTETYIGNAPKRPSQFIDADNASSNTNWNFTSNLHYAGKLDTIGTLLSADIDFARISNRGEAHLLNYFKNLVTGVQETDFLYTNTPNDYYIYSGRIDFTLPVKKYKIETGVRGSKIETDYDFRFYFNNNSLVIDPARTNHFLYDERILAAYVNMSGPLSKKLSLQAGLRMENTNSEGNSLTTGNVNARNYTDFFPSIFFTHRVSENYGVNYSYSRRLNRPNYGNLNPFRAYRDPYTWYEGNTGLKPQYTHSFSIAQMIKKIYNITASLQLMKDVMAEIPILYVDDTTTVYTTGNVNDGFSAGITGIAPVKITKKWDSQNTVVLSYNKFSMNSNMGLQENKQLFFMFQSNHTMLLPKEFRFELNFLYRGPQASGLYHMEGMHRVDIAIKRSFLKKKLEAAINAYDIFKGFRYKWSTDINGNVNDFNQYFRLRQVAFGLRYNFSKGQKVSERQRNQVEEMNRL